MHEDPHTLAARALLARLGADPDWISAIAVELRAAVEAEREAIIAHIDARRLHWDDAARRYRDAGDTHRMVRCGAYEDEYRRLIYELRARG
jgi:hypothetical protein